MKLNFRPMLLAAMAVFALAVMTAPASARPHHHRHHGSSVSRDMVRTAQMRLAELGYFSGAYDGILGPSTQAAIKDFQRANGLTPTGRLTANTYDGLATKLVRQQQVITINPGHPWVGTSTSQETPAAWHYAGSERLPIQNGELLVDDESNGASHRYTVKLNGQPFLLADNQPTALRVSDVFHLANEDALIITTYRGENACTYRNYLVTIHANGTVATKYEFESCAPSSEVREANNALFVRFAETMNLDGYDRWDVWRYENTQLVRL